MRSVLLMLLLSYVEIAASSSLRFTDVELDNVGRVEIRIDDPPTPADIGASDFTFEFWMKTADGNTAGASGCNQVGYSWVNGNIIFDRDRLPPNVRDYGLALGSGRIMFGVENSNGAYTICSARDVDDGAWHHVSIQRRLSDGRLWLHIDGQLETQATGPAGDISYPNSSPTNSPAPLLVIGREKFDLVESGYRGWIDEFRLSNALLYQAGNFTVVREPFRVETTTLALYHFDEGSGESIIDADGNQSPGVIRYNSATGPEWSMDTPFNDVADPGRLQFSQASTNIAENGGNLQLIVQRVGGAAGQASVQVQVDGGTAVANTDYQFTPITLSWNDGEAAQKTASITVVDDDVVGQNLTLLVGLTNAMGAQIGSPASATVTITENDSATPSPPTPPPPTPAPPTPTPTPTPTPPQGGGGGGGGYCDPWTIPLLCALLLLRTRTSRLSRHFRGH